MGSKLHGLIYAVVTANDDPEKLGRVKVSFDILGGSMQTDWCDVMQLYGGSLFVPELETQVVVAFLNGNLANGVVLGNVYSRTQKPPESGENSGGDCNKDGMNVMRYIRTKGSNRVVCNDDPTGSKLQLINALGINKIELNALTNTVSLESLNQVVIEAADRLTLKAKNCEIELNRNLKIESKKIEILNTAEMEVKASGQVLIKGKTVKLNS